MLDDVVQQDIAKNGEYRRAQGLLKGNRQRYEQRGRYTKKLLAEGLQETALAEYDRTFEAVELGALDAAEQNARYVLGSSPMVKALGTDRVMDLQEVVEYARALQEPNRFVLELGKEYVASALKTLYERARQSVKGIAKKKPTPAADFTEEAWFTKGNDSDHLTSLD